MADSPLRDTDLGDRAQLLKVAVYFGPACYLMLTFLWYFLMSRAVVPPWVFIVMLVLDIPLTVAGVFAIYHGSHKASTGLVNTMFAAGNIPPPRTYPNQDVMIVRGQYREAADYFRDHLTVEPDDNEARLRLADLLEQRLDDPDGAEQLYLEVRKRNPEPRAAMQAANGLIDLYRKQDRRDRLVVELARFAEHYSGTPGAEAAARLLKELKAGG